MRRALVAAALAWQAAAGVAVAQAPPLVEVRLEQEGRPLVDPVVATLVETPVGAPVSMREVRETITHLMSLARFEDVRVYRETAPGGVRLRFDLVPLHPVDRVEFQGVLALDADDLRALVTERFGGAPPAARAAEVTEALRVHYRDRGYVRATLSSRLDITHAPDRASLVIEVLAGPRARIATVSVDAPPGAAPPVDGTAVAPGRDYDAAAIDAALAEHEAALRAAGYYEARAVHTAVFNAAGTEAEVEVFIDRGPRVSVAFAGDPLPEVERDTLVPVRAEASADQDLLEDAALAIEAYLHDDGYRDALALYSIAESDEDLAITFDVRRGPRYVVTGISATGNDTVADATLLGLVPLEAGDPYVEASLRAGVDAALGVYGAQGFASVAIEAVLSVSDAPDGAGRLVAITLRVREGPRAVVRVIRLAGNTVFSDAEVLAFIATRVGAPFSAPTVAGDRDRLELAYLDAGHESVVVQPRAALVEDGTGADIELAIDEGPETRVDEVIVIGNERTALATILAEMQLASGDPLGFSARLESQRRLNALGLFRRVTITPLGRVSDPLRDLLVEVEEAPPTTLGYGVGLESGTRLRPTGPSGQAEERFEAAPRGFFEIGRSNLWGKNRSVNLFTRVSLRSRDAGVGADPDVEGLGFNEYRVFATFREPRAFGTGAEVLVTGILDQAIRSSFNFVTREARAEVGVAASPSVTLAGRYSYRHTRLFDERFADDEKPLIDRLFPQVRISKVAGSIIRDTRDDVLDPDAGTFLSLDADVAARAAGSEVGFVKAFVQAFTYRRLPATRRLVLALAARVGVADGFAREVPLVDAGGQPVLDASGQPAVEVVEDLPASERFFAGGDTTVRGFSLDRLGNAGTISASGFPTGGNGEIVLNAELRMALVGPLGLTTFVDAGNIFPRAGDLDLTDLRTAAGFGLRYDSPVGPIRLDLGFNLDPRELVPGTRERRSVFHISLGQAF
jgi:outer membrane protein insertion porin family